MDTLAMAKKLDSDLSDFLKKEGVEFTREELPLSKHSGLGYLNDKLKILYTVDGTEYQFIVVANNHYATIWAVGFSRYEKTFTVSSPKLGDFDVFEQHITGHVKIHVSIPTVGGQRSTTVKESEIDTKLDWWFSKLVMEKS